MKANTKHGTEIWYTSSTLRRPEGLQPRVLRSIFKDESNRTCGYYEVASLRDWLVPPFQVAEEGADVNWRFGHWAVNRDLVKSAERFVDDVLNGTAPAPARSLFDRIRKQVADETENTLPEVPQGRRRTVVRDSGDAVNIDAYMSRSLECWEQSERAPSAGKTIRIVLDMTVWCGAAQEAYAKMVCAGLAAWDRFRAAGWKVEVVGIFQLAMGTEWVDTEHGVGIDRACWVFPIASPGESLGPDELVSLTSTAVIRWASFGWQDSVLAVGHTGGRGMCHDVWDSFKDRLGAHIVLRMDRKGHKSNAVTEVARQMRDLIENDMFTEVDQL